MIKKLLLIVCAVATCAAVAGGEDAFDAVKKRLAEAGCVRLEFVNIIESQIFDVVDSTTGRACLASDGRYHVSVGLDVYLYDGSLLHSFSHDNNQVVIEKQDDEVDHSQEITFLTRLDELFVTAPLSAPNSYHLTRRGGDGGDLPDSMTLAIGGDPPAIQWLEFFDINDELNRIILFNQQLDSTCNEADFAPSFPDSAETVKLF